MKPQEAQEKSDRPGAEILLKQSQERCWLAVQGSREGLWDWDILTHQVYFAPRFKEILGYATAEMPNELKAWEAKLHPDDRARVLAALHNHLESRIPFDIEYRLRKKTGDYCWVHARGQGIWNEAGRATRIAGSISDITERKHSEVAFHEHHRLLQAINSVQTQFVTDAEPQVVFNNMLTHLLELTRSEYGFIGEILFAADGAPYIEKSYLKMRGRPFLKTHAISNLAWNEETRAFYAENAPKGMEFHNLETLFGAAIVTGKPVVANSPNTDSRRGGLPDGHPPLKAFLGVPFYSNNQMTGMVGIANREEGYDTTIIDYLQPFLTTCSRIVEAYRISCHKQQAEEKVREQAALLNVATDAIMVWGFNHRILYWNRGAERLYGWSSEEALGQDANELLYAEPLSNLPEMQRELEATGEWQGELNQMTKADQPIIVNSRWTLVRQEGKLPSILVVNTDITEKKQLEAQFLRAQRLESLGTLAGGIAHDFNNILTPILGFAQLLPKKLSLDPQAQNVFKIIETNARRGKDLIQQVLTFARGLEGDRGPVQVRHLIADIKKIATETFPKNIDIQTSVSNLHTVEGDATQLHQVLMNFAVNARDAMPQGGILRITAENFTIDANDARFHREAQEGTYVLIAVTDTGVGISADNLEHIFEPFFTTKEVGYGTGLGLSTAIGIVRSHGGFVEVSSEVDRGTQFNVFLPASTSAESIPATPPELPQGKGELILVVDDEAPIQEMTRAALETYGYRVLTASDGVEAIALFAQHQEQIQVVLLDLNMPVLGGYTTVSILQKIKPAVKIIIMSGLPTSREGGSALRTATTLAKPYTTEELLKKVADVVRSPSDFPKL